LLDRRRKLYLHAMGIPLWEARGPSESDAQPAENAAASDDPSVAMAPPPAGAAPQGDVAAGLGWDALRARVGECRRCPELAANRSQTVFGVGSECADWMIIGEAPGAEEDRQGEPFVGRAGRLLNAMLLALGLRRQDVYIANILKCRPPRNRDPRPEEAGACEPFLRRQIELVEPRVLLAVGRVAAQNLLQTDAPVGRLRGRVHRFGERQLPLVVTYHPAFLLRSPEQKAKAWKDLLLAARAAQEDEREVGE
jgi:DNA polymerase